MYITVTDGGQYSCIATVGSPYLNDDFTATQGTSLDVVVESKCMLSLTCAGITHFYSATIIINTDDLCKGTFHW